MRTYLDTGISRLRVAVAGLLMLTLAACATPFNANVSRFQSQLPAPAGQTFAIVPADPANAGGIEFGQYAQLVSDSLVKVGYAPVSDPSQAQLIVRFGYGVDNGRTQVRSTGLRDPFWGPWYGGGGWGRGGWGGGWGGRGFYGPGLWTYGWYDPWFDNDIQSYSVYTSKVVLTISRRADGQHLFEGHSEAVSTSNRLPYLVPNLIQALFTNFPGNSGEMVRITVAPEKKK